MINVLIVEDDQLVRKGLIFAMPWSDFDMKVIGEASNGQKALEFLEKESVQLIITDLNMPVMSGIEFIRIASKRYPKIFIAVLTLHQDFEYIQEALRLGVIDFITKVQLEKEKFDQVLERIHKRIIKEQQEDAHVVNETYFQTDIGFALFFANEIPHTKWLNQLKGKGQYHLLQIDQTLWFCTPVHELEQEVMRNHFNMEFNREKEGFVIVELTGIRDRFCNQIYRLLLGYKEKLFFYEYTDEAATLIKHIGDIEKENQLSIRDTSSVKKQLFTFQWVYDDEQFDAIINEVERLHLPNDHLHNLFLDIIDEWGSRYPFISTAQIERDIEFTRWSEAIKGLIHFRDMVKMTAGNGYAGDVVNSILLALKLIQDKLHQSLTADEVAKTVTMSRSYFNKCFKDIVGKSFHQYLREIRIKKAQTMIEQTNESLHWIAEQIGYLDEKYFSRVFREQTGVLPSEYRRKHRKGERRLK